MKFILWSAFYTNTFIFLIAIWQRSNLLIIACLLTSLFIILLFKKHQRYYAVAQLFPYYSLSDRVSFYYYVKNIFSNKAIDAVESNRNPILKTSIEFSIHPDISREEYMVHALRPVVLLKKDFNVKIGSSQCRKPFYSSLLNFDIPDYGLLSKEMISGLDNAARVGTFAYAAQEYSLVKSAEATIVLKLPINREYELCLTSEEGKASFRKLTAEPYIKAIELYLDAPFSPCYSLSELMDKRYNDYFNNVFELLNLIQDLRPHASGKPIGIRVGIKKESEFTELCRAMRECNCYLDFMSITGDESTLLNSDKGNFHLNYTYKSLEYALAFASSGLKEFLLEKEVKLIAVGAIDNGFDLLKLLSLGASSCMHIMPVQFFIDHGDLYSNEDSSPFIKSRVLHYQRNVLRETIQLMEYAGFDRPGKIQAKVFFRKDNLSSLKSFEEIYVKNNHNGQQELLKNFMYN